MQEMAISIMWRSALEADVSFMPAIQVLVSPQVISATGHLTVQGASWDKKVRQDFLSKIITINE